MDPKRSLPLETRRHRHKLYMGGGHISVDLVHSVDFFIQGYCSLSKIGCAQGSQGAQGFRYANWDAATCDCSYVSWEVPGPTSTWNLVLSVDEKSASKRGGKPKP